MRNKLPLLLEKFRSNPRQLFLIDSLGALVTACLTGFVLARFEGIFGIPPKILYTLSFVALLYAVYSILCFSGKPTHWRPLLKAIAFANLIYILISVGLVFLYYPQVSVLGLLYFIGEFLVIGILIYIEFKTAYSDSNSR